jgi:hypothetical protein
MKSHERDIDRDDELAISLRAYAEMPARGRKPRRRSIPGPSSWTLVFDTETTTDASQAFRFGAYQIRDGSELNKDDAGIMYEPTALTAEEMDVLATYARAHDLKLMTRELFVEEVFYGRAYDHRATIVGFNLPFDISRLAVGHGAARDDMRGGFTFRLSRNKRWPNVRVKHLTQKAALIKFAGTRAQPLAHSERKRGDARFVRGGFLVDIHTFATAMFSRSFSLASLAEFLNVPHQKLASDEHGLSLSEAYLGYAVQDVQATWECYEELTRRYALLDLPDTPPHQVFSEASIGKGHLKKMGVRSWREVQPKVSPELLATILSTYFGGRSEVRIRRQLCQVVLCDFLSMYPTVCTLMGLWRFVIAKTMTWRDGTDEIRTFLREVDLPMLQRRESWSKLNALVQIRPSGDVFPVRAQYGDESQATIGANLLSCDQPLWITLADCIASMLLTGRAPTVVRAIIFEPGKPQSGLRPIAIGGDQGHRVDPVKRDFFKQLIELRYEIKKRRDSASDAEKAVLNVEQNAVKIAANATSYGIYVETNVKEKAEPQLVTVHTTTCEPFQVLTTKVEEPGPYFHPLLATLITGAARLMLAIAERLVTDAGLEWAFCDTDSIAIARPAGMGEHEFRKRVDQIVEWFVPLNPYAFGGSILKVEDVNFSLTGGHEREPLFCWAVSAKRYALFNLDPNGRPVLRKASAHALGHLRPPYDASNPAHGVPAPVSTLDKIGVEHWQHDLWWKIISAAPFGTPDQVDLDYHPALQQPAVSRYAATTPKLLRWFDGYNSNRSYADQVKPFGFLMALFADQLAPSLDGADTAPAPKRRRRAMRIPKPVAPFDDDIAKVAANAFDRETGEPVPRDALKSYAQVLAQYHLHPESKFLNGNYLDRGVTQRRHVKVAGIRHIGKEANKWEEQFFVGFDDDEQIDYGLGDTGGARLADLAREAADRIGQRELALGLRISRGTLTRILKGQQVRQAETMARRLLAVMDRS